MNPVLFDFEPRLLASARKRIVASHPGTASAPVGLAAAGLEDLRKRIETAATSVASLEHLATELTPREVRSLVDVLGRWEALRGAVALLLRLRLRATHLPRLWMVWQRYPLVAELRSLLLEAGERFGWETGPGPLYASHAPRWVTEEPGVAICRYLDERGLSYRDVSDLAGRPFRPDTPLSVLVRNAVLTDGSAAQLRAEGHERLFEWQRGLAPEKHERFGRNYLTQLDPDEWHIPLLRRIEQLYGLPRTPRLSRFWEPISEEVQHEFQTKLLAIKIRGQFGSDERGRYWLRWLDQLADVKGGWAGTTRYAILDFGGFGVIEFFEVGNAAFFYPSGVLRHMTTQAVSRPKDLKRPELGARLIHNPPGAWYHRADRMVRRWIRASRK